MIWLAILGVLAGILIGSLSPVTLPVIYMRYMAVAILACLDSVLGGVKSNLEGKFDNLIFLTGFFANAMLASLLVYLGDKLAVDLYLAAIVAFGVRLFENLAIIRRHLIKRWYPNH
jgi:small basic protein